MARRLTRAEALDSWRVDAELSGGHTVQQTLGFIAAPQDLEDDSRALPPGFVLADCEPRRVTRLRGWFRR
jgi:hypothetical protein